MLQRKQYKPCQPSVVVLDSPSGPTTQDHSTYLLCRTASQNFRTTVLKFKLCKGWCFTPMIFSFGVAVSTLRHRP